MARLLVVFDPSGRLTAGPDTELLGIKSASLDVPDELEGRDIYELARRLSELLLEQL